MFDLKIQPVITKSDTSFEVMSVYRDKNKTKVEKFSRNVEDIIQKKHLMNLKNPYNIDVKIFLTIFHNLR